jgi:RNA polymerase sigma-70 factor, ECF subfamily
VSISVTDAELVDRAVAGQQDAFRSLVERHQRSVFNLLARMLRNPALAEEQAQETFLKAFRHLRTFDPRFKFSNWILRIAHNTAIDCMRRSRPAETSLDEPDERDGTRLADIVPDATAPDPSDALERQDAARVLGKALSRLRPEYRRLVVLRYQEDLSYEEIAEITGLPLGTVKSHLHRARAEMAAFLEGQGLARRASDRQACPATTPAPLD